MRSYGRSALSLLLITGFAVASEPVRSVTLSAGENLSLSILTLTNVVQQCYLESPVGYSIEFKPDDNSNEKYQLLPDDDLIQCAVRVNNLDAEDNGLWKLYAVSTNGVIQNRTVQLTVISEETSTLITDTESAKTTEESLSETSTTDNDREDFTFRTQQQETTESYTESTTNKLEEVSVIDIDPGYFVTKIGETHSLRIPYYDFIINQECSLVTPNGERYNLDHLDIYGVEVINDYRTACGVKLHIVSEDMVGNWMLISRGRRYESQIEKRLPFTIIIEETVNALPSEITVIEGNDIYFRLEDPTSLYDTCRLVSPFDEERVDVEKDKRYVDTCGFVVRNANITDSGIWKISYGDKTIYQAWVRVDVHGGSEVPTPDRYTWTLDRPVTQVMGPESTVYCRVVDVNHNIVSEGFGRCNVTLSRVTSEHAGTWRMFVGLQGRVFTDELIFHVSVREAAPKPVVSTSVTTNKPTVTLTCSVSSPQPVRSCKFRDPSGRILIANPGVGEGRYTFHGMGSSYSSGVHRHECGIQITDPTIRDLGLWRCAMETESENYYGFLAALCPWAMRDPEVAASVQSEPVLNADAEVVSGLVGESVAVSCSVQSPIRYCYFRARNGTTYSVSPGESSQIVEYSGAGFDAGECSARLLGLRANDSGLWSCHVGFPDPEYAEQRAQFRISIQDALVVEQKVERDDLLIYGRVHDDRPLDYCRFVRIDGLGFTSDNVPEGYRGESILSEGWCQLRIMNPSTLDMHPWTVAVRVRGHHTEYMQQTIHTLRLPSADSENGTVIYFPLAWIFVIVIGMSLIIVGFLVGPKRNRAWTYARATVIRDSFRRSFIRKTASEQNVPQKNTPMSA